MHNEFTAIVEQDDGWHIAYCAELPGANGQVKKKEKCLKNLSQAILFGAIRQPDIPSAKAH